MDEMDRNLILEVKERFPADVVAHIRKVVAFGSRAEGQGEAESDLDLLILVDRKTPELEGKIDDVAYQVMWDHDFKPIISIKVMAEADFRSSLDEGFTFYKRIEQEGVPM